MAKVCSIVDCSQAISCRGWCSTHYHRWQRHGNPLTVKKPKFAPGIACSVADCENAYVAKGLCSRHYMQVREHGRVFKSRFDGAKPDILSDRQEYRLAGGTVIFDLDFVPPKSVISISEHGYARFGKEYAHRLVMETPSGKETDHINHNRLDNRRRNLRICEPNQHGGNRPLSKSNKSGYLGVHWASKSKKWTAQVQKAGKKTVVGYFDTPKEAAVRRDKVARELHGEYANLNFGI